MVSDASDDRSFGVEFYWVRVTYRMLFVDPRLGVGK